MASIFVIGSDVSIKAIQEKCTSYNLTLVGSATNCNEVINNDYQDLIKSEARIVIFDCLTNEDITNGQQLVQRFSEFEKK